MQRNTCPNCGAAIATDDPHGLCPACLLKQSLVPVEGDPLRPALESELQGQYRIVRLLGQGGMGAVYLARDLALDREVAVKVVRTDAREMHDRFRGEARTAARLSHPNIVPLHAYGEVAGMPYFVMGYVRGESLADRLRRDGKLPEEESRRVLAELASALDHAHRQGVVHRDIKPDNVLIDDESGRAMLTDFGVAKGTERGEVTKQGSIVGTPHYMSPEQASGSGDVDGRSDLYSLGVLAHVMLSGHLPFEGASVADVLAKQMTQEPPPLRALAPAVSDATAEIVERCLAKDPNKRWPDARSLQIVLGTPGESALPDALQAVESHGITGVAVAILLLLIIRLLDAPWFALALNAGVIVIAYVFVLARLRMDGFPFARAQQTIWREPSWWPFWYPRALRRRGNVWDRMPAAARRVRAWIPAFAVYTVVLFTAPFPNFVRHPEAFVLKVVVGLAFMLVLFPILEFSARRELRRKGLTAADAHRVMLSVPPSRTTFWARPHIAAVLAPAGRGS